MKRERPAEASYGERFHTMFPEKLYPLADATLPKATLPTLIWCWNNLDHRAFRALRQSDVARLLKCSQSSVGEALLLLEDRGFLQRRGSGPRQEWRLSLLASWVGTAGAYQAAKREREQGIAADAKRARFKPEVIDGGRDD